MSNSKDSKARIGRWNGEVAVDYKWRVDDAEFQNRLNRKNSVWAYEEVCVRDYLGMTSSFFIERKGIWINWSRSWFEGHYEKIDEIISK